MRHSNAYTFRFAAMVTIVCSVLLAGAATILKPRQVENEKLDIKKNILASVNIKPEEGESFTRQDIQEKYAENIREMVIDLDGNIIEGKRPVDLDPKKDTNLLPIFERVSDGEIMAYIIPVSGKGLWSTIYGYVALGPDASTIMGVTFYKHGETPGLGGEIEKEWFTNNFAGKKIVNDQGDIVSIKVVKSKVDPDDPEAYHSVDGIGGATLTGRGIEEFLKRDLLKYEPFLSHIIDEEGGV